MNIQISNIFLTFSLYLMFSLNAEAASFPSELEWSPLLQGNSFISDVNTDGNNNGREIVGDSTASALYMYNNGNELFNLNKSIFKERIIRVFGNTTNQKLIPINESTEIANINGFVFKPDYSRKTRSSQFFFVNGRFIKTS